MSSWRLPRARAASRTSATSATGTSTRSSRPGEIVTPGQHIGWTCEGDWHVHLSEFVFTTRRAHRRQPAPARRKAAPVRRPSAARDPRDSLLRTRDSGVDATAEHERRPPSAGGDAAQARRALRPGRRARPRERPAVVHRLVPGAAVARRATPSVPAGGDDRRRGDRACGSAARGVPRRAAARIARRAATSLRAPSRTCRRTAACASTLGALRRRLLVPAVPARYWDTTRLPDGRYSVRVRAWDVAGNLATAESRGHDRERRLASDVVGTRPSQRPRPAAGVA